MEVENFPKLFVGRTCFTCNVNSAIQGKKLIPSATLLYTTYYTIVVQASLIFATNYVFVLPPPRQKNCRKLHTNHVYKDFLFLEIATTVSLKKN